MSTWVGVGRSTTSDSSQAGRDAAAQALAQMGLSTAHLVLVFASARFDHAALLAGVRAVTPEAAVVGCSTAGEITADGPSKRSVVVVALQSNVMTAIPGFGPRLSAAPRQAGETAAWSGAHSKAPNPRVFLMFPDGVSGNAAEALRGVQMVLGTSFPVVGGSAGDDLLFRRSVQYHGDAVTQDSVVGVLLSGGITVGIGARHGWRPLGKPRLVTRALANVVHELDGRAAVSVYQEYFGKGAEELQRESLARMTIIYPLGLPIPGEEEHLLRNVLHVTPQGDLVYAGEVPEGSSVRLMMGSKHHALVAARRAAEQAMRGLGAKSVRLALVFGSASRARLFGRGAEAEIRAIREVVGSAVPIAGFYGYGEIAPLSSEQYLGQSYYQNETLVVMTLAE
ncbi:MAG: FIST C-terminal domain-containing protein [Candidatus Omnitrophica bacterium]|nr:FIST C-terminal domain-containing protein [Candidatus Omnitrophota bacterium]